MKKHLEILEADNNDPTIPQMTRYLISLVNYLLPLPSHKPHGKCYNRRWRWEMELTIIRIVFVGEPLLG